MSASNSFTDNCPLCKNAHTETYWQDKKRQYKQCTNCQLVFVPEVFHLSRELEKAEYDKHHNDRLDDGYRRFLNRALEPLLEEVIQRFSDDVIGLDFGCGEGAFLSQMAVEQGVEIRNYDLYYHHNPDVLTSRYDFIVMTEVLEHLAQPNKVIPQLLSMLKPNGLLAVMTKRVLDKDAFSRWHYKNDPTHICFYSVDTFKFIAQRYDLQLSIKGDDLVFLARTKYL